MSAKKKISALNVAIVGTGGMARWQATLFKRIPGVKLAAFCDIDRARAEAFSKEFGPGAVHTDFRKLFRSGGIDAVTVVASDAAHESIAVAALEAGLPVLCEKPMAPTLAGARRMLAVAKKARLPSMINFSKRDAPALQEAKRRIDDGAIGRVMHVDASYLQSWLANTVWGDWRTSPGWLWRLSTKHGSAGCLGDIGCHIYDMAAFLAGDIVSLECRLKTFDKAKNGRIGPYVLDANDSFVATAAFASGALGTVQASRWASGHPNREYIGVYGDQGAFEIDYEKGGHILNAFSNKTMKWTRIECKPTPTNVERFVGWVRTGKKDASDFLNGYKVQSYVDASERSSKTGKIIKLY
jgi:predicted dehydrogenase